jgi:hypothetical protein
VRCCGWRRGYALKTEILRADVARNKATEPRRDEAAEWVRNPESGRCRLGKPAHQRSPVLASPKGAEPLGGIAASSCTTPVRPALGLVVLESPER